MLYAGVDTHKKFSTITIIDQHGERVDQKQIRTSKQAFSSALTSYEEPMSACVEAGYNWGPVYDWLVELCDETTLAHPSKVRMIAESKIKTDKFDSEALARLLRADMIPEAWASSADERARKRVLRQRMFLVKLRTMVKNRIHSLLIQHSLEMPDVSDLFGAVGKQWLQQLQLPSQDGDLLRDDLKLLDQIEEHISTTECLIKEISKGDDAMAWIGSIPGLGKVFAPLIRHEICDIRRFASAKKLISYCGLAPSTYASGLKIRHGRLIKACNKWLKYAFIEAVTAAIRRCPELRASYQRTKDRLGAKPARVATARKLCELVWNIWSQERFYEYR
jgi:transposase